MNHTDAPNLQMVKHPDDKRSAFIGRVDYKLSQKSLLAPYQRWTLVSCPRNTGVFLRIAPTAKNPPDGKSREAGKLASALI